MTVDMEKDQERRQCRNVLGHQFYRHCRSMNFFAKYLSSEKSLLCQRAVCAHSEVHDGQHASCFVEKLQLFDISLGLRRLRCFRVSSSSKVQVAFLATKLLHHFWC